MRGLKVLRLILLLHLLRARALSRIVYLPGTTPDASHCEKGLPSIEVRRKITSRRGDDFGSGFPRGKTDDRLRGNNERGRDRLKGFSEVSEERHLPVSPGRELIVEGLFLLI